MENHSVDDTIRQSQNKPGRIIPTGVALTIACPLDFDWCPVSCTFWRGRCTHPDWHEAKTGGTRWQISVSSAGRILQQ